ncbi:MAG TPA: hypothetical protein VEI02_13225, partial [Planctomycetota bacterium]|nr:hypothetical protein [Planctomycetota bacterium]
MATFAEFEHLSGLAASSFTPSTPVSSRELFAGRWGEVRRVADAVAQTGLHVVIFGERGVGKTSLANVVRIILDVIERSAYDRTVRVDPSTPPPPERTVVKVNANKGDSFPAIWERAFNEIFWDEDRPHVGFSRSAAPQERITLLQHLNAPSPLTADVVRHVLGTLPKSVFVFD